jgi:PAS domain S-box-containing protein
LSLPADHDLLHSAIRGDARPTGVFRVAGATLRPVVVSDSLKAALDVADDDAVAQAFEDAGGVPWLQSHARSRRPLELAAGKHRLVMSARSIGDDGLQVRGVDAEQAEVSNTLTADIIGGLSNDETGVVFLDPAGRVLAVNYAFYRYFPAVPGFPRLGEPFAELVRGAIAHGYLPQAAGREERFVRWTVDHFMGESAEPISVLSGAGRWINTSRMRFRNGAVAILLIDMTEMRQELEQLTSFAQNTRNMVFVRVADGSSTARVWGQDAKRILGERMGRSRVELSGWRACIHPEDRERYEAALAQRQKTGEAYEMEFRFVHPEDGRIVWLLENGWRSIDSVTGQIYLDNYLLDITERKEADAELRHNEVRFQEFAEMAADWAFEADADMNLTWISQNFSEISGMSTARYVGRSWAEITEAVLPDLPRDQVRMWRTLLKTWSERQPFRISPLLFRFPGGNDRMVEVGGTPVFDHRGRFVGHRGIARDVTPFVRAREDARAAMRAAEAANRAKSEFIANMSHELRTPLNAIIGFAHVMEQEMFGPMTNARYHGYAADIAASGQHLLSLVNDVLDLSRIEADRVKVDRETVAVCPEVDRVLSLFRESAGRRRLYSNGCSACTVQADRRLLRQMLINLVGNAVKFTGEDGEIRVDVTVEGDELRLTVTDDGIGMNADDIRTALEPFGRAAGADIAGGTGLGLPLTRKLAELHGGSLSIKSTPRKGTSVMLMLPRAEADAALTGGSARMSA